MSVELISAMTSLKSIVPISSGTVSSPVAHIDLTLPSGYLSYQLRFNFRYDDVGFNGIAVYFFVAAAWQKVSGTTFGFYVGDTLDYAVGLIELQPGVGSVVHAGGSFMDVGRTNAVSVSQVDVAGVASSLRLVPVNGTPDPAQTAQSGSYSLLGVPA